MTVLGLSCHAQAPLVDAPQGQHTKNIDLNFKKTDFTYTVNNEVLEIRSSKYQLVFDHNSPALPYVAINVLVGQHDECTGSLINSMTHCL